MLQGKTKLSKTKEEEGDDSCRRLFRGAALQRNFSVGRRRWSCTVGRKKKVELRCNTVPQHEEEGDGSCHRLLRCAAAQ
jgi:hypothetical protein